MTVLTLHNLHLFKFLGAFPLPLCSVLFFSWFTCSSRYVFWLQFTLFGNYFLGTFARDIIPKEAFRGTPHYFQTSLLNQRGKINIVHLF